MFGLRQQVGRDHLRIAGAVGEDVDFRRPGQLVDPHRAEHLTLGLVHECIAGADDLVHRRHRLRAVSHRRDGLRAADAEHAVGTRQMTARHHGLMRAGGQAGHDLIHPRHLGRYDGHHRRGQQREPPARNVAAHPLHRNDPMAKKGTGQHLDVQGRQAGQLRLRKPADIGDGKFGIRPRLRVKGGDGGLALFQRDLETDRVGRVKAAGEIGHRRVAFGAHTGQHIGHHARQFRRVGVGLGRGGLDPVDSGEGHCHPLCNNICFHTCTSSNST